MRWLYIVPELRGLRQTNFRDWRTVLILSWFMGAAEADGNRNNSVHQHPWT